MFNAAIQDILGTRLQHLPDMVMAGNLRRDIDELVLRHIPSGKIAIIDDIDTAAAYGNSVYSALKNKLDVIHITLPRGTTANETVLAEIKQKSERVDLLIAVGSGTINDLTKYAAYLAQKPYIIFPTAASMNGYTSINASISMHGHKQSLGAALPVAIFADMELISSAPPRLTQAGLGDSMARPTAQADWLLSHHLLGTAYDDAPYQMINTFEPIVFNQSKALLYGDKEIMKSLFLLLLVSGFGMTLANSSAPASGAEHMIAHAYGMSMGPALRQILHGEEIALTTLTAAKIQENLMVASSPRLLLELVDIQEQFHATEIASFQPLFEKKRSQMLAVFPDGNIPKATWEQAREAVAGIHISSENLSKIASNAGLATTSETLGWDARSYTHIIDVARCTRDRFTCLDIG